MSRVLVAGVDTSTQSTKVRVTDAETGEMVRFGQAKHPDGTSVNPDAWWQAFQEAAEPGAGSITLVPHFDGERTPNRPDATAALYGMTLANTRRENIARAFVEGLLCSQRDCLELVKGLGVDVKRILLIGGGTKFAAVRALAPAILGMDVELPETDEYVAIGAARQAAWVLSGETEPPTWPVKVETTLTGEPTPQVYEQYVRWRG